MKNKVVHKWISCPVFLTGVNWIKAPSRKEFVDYVKTRGYDIQSTDNPNSNGCTCYCVDGVIWVWFKGKPDNATIVHETSHITRAMLSQKNIPLTDETQEVYAYLHEWLFVQLGGK